MIVQKDAANYVVVESIIELLLLSTQKINSLHEVISKAMTYKECGGYIDSSYRLH